MNASAEIERDMCLSADSFMKKLNIEFTDKTLLVRALTHSSFSNEANSKGVSAPSNERLEFLGDSVLSLVICSYLYKTYPKFTEGDLTRIRAFAVDERANAGYARSLEIADHLLLGKGTEAGGGRTNQSILNDAFEALVGAIYLDKGFDFTSDFILPLAIPEIKKAVEGRVTKDYKTALQQIVQLDHTSILEYVPVKEEGPDNKKLFTIEARLNGNVIGTGVAGKKRDAEQLAAKQGLSWFAVSG